MHYYQFNIGDYASHTQHLDESEDLAYRRMLDYCYLNEIGLPESVDEVARLIRMRTHSVCIANVLHEFFTLHSDGFWRSDRVEREIQAFRDKSGKAAKAARKRWDKAYADALQTHSERNAKHKPITINHKPVKESKNSASEVATSDPKYTTEDYRLAEWMAEKVSVVAPKVKPPNLKSWAETVRLMRERDNHTHHDIAKVFGFANQDSFWSVNILSPSKLRDKFGELDAKMRRVSNENTKPVSGIDPNERGISGAERTRRARELRRREEQGITY